MVRITAAESERDQRRAATNLHGRGLKSGDRLAVIAGSSAELIAVVLGALRTGIVPVLINPALPPIEQDSLLTNAEPALIVRDLDLAELVSVTAAKARAVELAPHPQARPMLYTSGTTGTPKGVYSGIFDEATARAAQADEENQWEFSPHDRNLVVSPLYHSAPLRFAMGTLLAGGTVIIAGPFSSTRLATIIESESPTTMFVVPTHLHRLLALDNLPPLTSFRLVAHAGAPCSQRLKRTVLEKFPRNSVWEFYGATECQFTAVSPDEWLAHPGTVGRARTGRKLSVDSDGTIWCEVPDFAHFTYWRDPERTAAAWRNTADNKNSACSVGDLGRLDDGYLFIDGRRNDLIISGGVNVYPLQVEGIIKEHPAIIDAAVFGVDDEEWGQRVEAAIVGAIDPDQIADWLHDRLTPPQRPKRITLVANIPTTATGKVRRNRLAADLGLE